MMTNTAARLENGEKLAGMTLIIGRMAVKAWGSRSLVIAGTALGLAGSLAGNRGLVAAGAALVTTGAAVQAREVARDLS